MFLIAPRVALVFFSTLRCAARGAFGREEGKSFVRFPSFFASLSLGLSPDLPPFLQRKRALGRASLRPSGSVWVETQTYTLCLQGAGAWLVRALSCSFILREGVGAIKQGDAAVLRLYV